MEAITVNNVSKNFRIPHERKTTVFQNIVGILKGQTGYEQFWALKDISFSVQKGETFGIIGKNGSGKSTLLKILAKVMYPDSGAVATQGKIAPFLELGVGFQSEMSARENVFIYSSILGISQKQTRKNYDDIFEFAELKRFEDMKLKNFSSGMYTRLAFATAVYSNPEILLMDEVLAVGDEAFQNKCMDKINEFRSQGKTIVLVTHATDAVKKLCSRSLLLNNGTMVSIGDSAKVLDAYHALG
ncbi:MAG TPA: ATP-binding protein [Dehalococcoidia bacterium]|nr:ATP-binding protein [Dehalococcoidia bacterium]